MTKAAYQTRGITAFVMFGIVYFIGCLRKLHVIRQPLWEEYRQTHPNGYGKSQLYEHLASNARDIMERSTAYYVTWTEKKPEDCMA